MRVRRLQVADDEPDGERAEGDERGREHEWRYEPVLSMSKPVMRGERMPAMFPTKL
jgi:hypothetical protein